ncbi:hypothetical protein AC1031_001015 [Aphanomyces cochlioides]|nr:hypothetical protein AC1031_001015 [Aphanomyces cochlioides]
MTALSLILVFAAMLTSLGWYAAIAAGIASSYVQFNNEIALHLQHQQEHSPWRAVYSQATSDVVTMDVDGRGGSTPLFLDADVAAAAAASPRCNQFPAVDGPCAVDVVFAVSKCLDTSTIVLFSKWMQKLANAERKFLTGGKTCDVTFSTVLLTEGKTASSSHLTVDEISKYFTPFGNVYCSLNEFGQNYTKSPAAIVSLFGDKDTHDAIVAYEEECNVHTVFNFYVCSGGVSASACQSAHSAIADDSVLLPQEADLFQHNPFKTVQSFHCAKSLPNGLPVVYVDPDGHRQCYCKCPSGFEETIEDGQRVCVRSPKENCACYWSGRKYSYDITRATDGKSDANSCRIGNLYPKTISRIPYPRSNYVSFSRTNDGDLNDDTATKGSPLVKVQVSQVQPLPSSKSPIVLARDYPWSYFVAHRDTIGNNISFSTPGIYSIKMTAQGYHAAADCEVCLAVVDRFRPTSRAKCPAPVCDQPSCLDSTAVLKPQAVAEYSAKNIQAAQAVLDAHFAYSSAENVVNDVCGEERCDFKRFSRKAMFDSVYVPDASFPSGNSCFVDKITPDIVTRLQQSPFGSDLGSLNVARPVPDNQCTRCCKLETKLQEYWHDYQCGNATAPAKVCSGSDAGCVTEQCLVALGSTFFTATADIKPDYKTVTKELIAQVFPDKGYQSATEIHLLLECSSFGKTNEGKCAHVARIQELLAVSSTLNDRTVLVDDKQYVFWRFNVDGGDWRSIDDKQLLTFDGEHAVLRLEAWSQCGLVKKFVFHIYLHLNQRICLNDEFDGMWYQASSNADATGGALCNYFESDFAELTFDFNPLAGLVVNETQTLPWVSTGVSCAVQYETTKAPALLFESKSRNCSLIRRFSFQMQSVPTTRADTTFTISCNFTYESTYQANKTQSLPASKSFTIKNCDKPDWDCPFGLCADKCAASGAVAPFYACQGRTVYASTKEETVVAFQKKTCCDSCGSAQCQPLFGGLNEEEDVYRCVVTEPKTLSDDAQQLFVEESSSDIGVSTGVIASACLLMVGGVLLVVLNRQRRSDSLEDGYYPLLDHRE